MNETGSSRPFAWDDVPALHELVKSRWAVDGAHGQRRIGDFWWALRNTPADDTLAHMQVWPRGDGSLMAVAWLDPPEMGDVIVEADAPAAESVFDRALDWLEEEHRVAGSGGLSIVVLAGDERCAEGLRRRGYTPGKGGNVRFWRALESSPVPSPLPDGASLRGVSTEADAERRAFVEASSFGASGITGAYWRSLIGRLPAYRPELDVIAVAADGSGASACTCWYDEATRCGEFEAVGTLEAFQRLGMGKAVIVEGLRRLYELGARQAIVETTISNAPAIALYRSCGFEEVARDYGWMKDG